MKKFLEKKWARKLAVGLVFFSIVGAISLAIIVHLHPVLLTDIKISNEIQENKSVHLLPLMQLISIFGEPPVTIIVTLGTALAFYLFAYQREALFVLFTFISDGMNGAIKLLINRPRPTDTLVTVYQKLTDSSFPSGHVVHYVVFFGFLVTTMVLLDKLPTFLRIVISSISMVLIVLISISRIYLGAHWAKLETEPTSSSPNQN